MPISPEVPIDQQVQERPETFSEKLLQPSGVQVTPANVKPVVNSQGQPMIATPTAGSAKIQLPGDQASLVAQAKGSITNAATWLAKFLLRMIAIKNSSPSQGGSEEYASNDTE